jgi:hypothetical protein
VQAGATLGAMYYPWSKLDPATPPPEEVLT